MSLSRLIESCVPFCKAGLFLVLAGILQALQAILRGSQMARRYLFNFAVRVERTALHSEILIYMVACSVVRPEGPLKISVLCFKVHFWTCWRKWAGQAVSQLHLLHDRIKSRATGETKIEISEESSNLILHLLLDQLGKYYSKLVSCFAAVSIDSWEGIAFTSASLSHERVSWARGQL